MTTTIPYCMQTTMPQVVSKHQIRLFGQNSPMMLTKIAVNNFNSIPSRKSVRGKIPLLSKLSCWNERAEKGKKERKLGSWLTASP